MDLANAWTIASKDFSIFRKKKSVLYSLIALPLFVSIGLPAFIQILITRPRIPVGTIELFLNSFSFLFIVIGVFLPVTLASYSIVGEKIEKNLEPLLSTPMTDGEFLLGKTLAAFLPALASTYGGAAIFMTLMDVVTHSRLGYFFPNWNMAVILLLTVPLVCLFSVEANIIISSRINDIRAATQLGSLLAIPFGVIYVMFEINFLHLNIGSLLLICAVVTVADLVFIYLTKVIFRREEILTKWR